MALDVLVVHGSIDSFEPSSARAVVDELQRAGFEAETLGLFDGSAPTVAALTKRAIKASLTKLPLLSGKTRDLVTSREGTRGTLARALRSRLFRSFLDAVIERDARVIVATSTVTLALLEDARAAGLALPPVVTFLAEATGDTVVVESGVPVERGYRETPELRTLEANATKRVLVLAHDLPPETVRDLVWSLGRTLRVEVEVHVGLDRARVAELEGELDAALVRGTVHGYVRDPFASFGDAHLIVGAAKRDALHAAMAAGRPFVAVGGANIDDMACVAAMLRLECGRALAASDLGAALDNALDSASLRRLGANGRRASDPRAASRLVAAIAQLVGSTAERAA
jgi:hypothetical protein